MYNPIMMLKITSAVSLAVVVLAGVVLVNGHNDDRQNEQGTAGGVRRLTSLPAQSTVVNGNDNNRNNINRDWLGKYVADHENPRNPNHHRAMVEMLIRYGTAHVGKTLSMEDVKDALAIEFLSQVDGKPIPIAGSEGSLFIGTIGELDAVSNSVITVQRYALRRRQSISLFSSICCHSYFLHVLRRSTWHRLGLQLGVPRGDGYHPHCVRCPIS